MRRTYPILLLVWLLLGQLLLGCRGEGSISYVDTNEKLQSQILDSAVRYTVYFPEDYNASNREYPILYLLHGFTDDDRAWLQKGDMKRIADRELKKRHVAQMIIVTPDAGLSWYLNNYDGKLMYEDFFIKEFIPHIESKYRTRSEKKYRAIAGLSMGGHGALIFALKYPQLFSTVAPLSASIRTNEEFINLDSAMWERMFTLPYGSNMGEKRITDHLKQNTVLNLIEEKSTEDLNHLRYYIDCGDDDHLIVCNMRLHELLIQKKVPHEFRIRDGGHEWTYWQSALPEVLSFVSEDFQD